MDWSSQTFLYSSFLCLEITAWWVVVVRSEQLPQPTHAVFNKTVISSTGRCTKQTKNKCALEISCGKLLDINQWLMLGLSQFWSSLKFHWFYYYQKSLSRLVPIAFDSLSLCLIYFGLDFIQWKKPKLCADYVTQAICTWAKFRIKKNAGVPVFVALKRECVCASLFLGILLWQTVSGPF